MDIYKLIMRKATKSPLKIVLIFTILSFIIVNLFLGYYNGFLTKTLDLGDGNIYRYIVWNNLNNWQNYSLKYGIPQRIFYPDKLAALYTDPLYLQSIIFAPIYLITQNIELLGPTIFTLQIIIQTIALTLLVFELFKFFSNKKQFNLKQILIISAFTFPAVMWGTLLPSVLDRHLQLALSGFFTFAIFTFVKSLNTKNFKYFLLTIAFLELFVSTNVYYLVFTIFTVSIFFIAIFIIYFKKITYFLKYIFKQNVVNYFLKFTRKNLALILLLTLTTILMLLTYIPFLTLAKTNIKRSLHANVVYSADLFNSYFLPYSKSGTVYRIALDSLMPFYTKLVSPEAQNFLGGFFIIVIIMTLINFSAILKNRVEYKQALGLILIILFSIWIFSSGPYLRIFGLIFKSIKMPFYWLWKFVFIFKSIRVPARIVINAIPFIVMLYVASIYSLYGRINGIKSTKIKNRIFILFIFLLILISFLDVQYKVNNLQTKEKVSKAYKNIYIYKKLDNIDGNTLLEIPFSPAHHTEGRLLMYIPYHSKYLINGYSGFFPKHTVILQHNLLSSAEKDDKSNILKSICTYPVDIILIHTNELINKSIYKKTEEIPQNIMLSNILEHTFTTIYRDKNYLILITKKQCQNFQ